MIKGQKKLEPPPPRLKVSESSCKSRKPSVSVSLGRLWAFGLCVLWGGGVLAFRLCTHTHGCFCLRVFLGGRFGDGGNVGAGGSQSLGVGGVSQELAFGISASAGGARVVRTCGSGTSDLLPVR